MQAPDADHPTQTVPERGRASRPGSQLERGSTVGRFVVLERVGAGGMGTVYAAWDPQLSRRVALKVLRADSDATERGRTLREARALAQLSHPNVVRVFELGDIDGAPFIAMELVEGSSLRDLLKTPVPEQRLFELFDAAGRGLAAVHGLGIVHRDFKPGNVFVGFDRRVCIGDFGLAIASTDDSGPAHHTPESTPGGAALEGELTEQGLAPGTPAYMSPEQMRGEPLDARADQFSFAVALWHALYGELPFGREGRGVVARVAPAVPARRSLAGRLAEPVLRRALDFDRERRFADLPALLEALTRARRRPAQWGVALALGVTLSVLVGVVGPRVLAQDPCGVRALAASAIPEAVRARLRAGSGANPLSDVSAHVDAWTAQWLSAAESACRRTDLPDRPAVRACLDRRLGDLTALTTVLASRGDSVDTALPAVLALPTPASCLSARDQGEQHVDTETDRALERRLSDARAAYLSGRPKDALELAREVAAAARATGDARLQAEAQYVLGLGATGTGDLVEGERALRDAIAGAMTTHTERLEAEAWIDLLNVVGDRARRFDEALRLIPVVRAATARLAEDVEVQAHERFIEAIVRADVGDLGGARPLALEAVTLAEARVPRDPRAVSRARSNLGNLLASLGEVDAAVKELHAARAALEGALPPGHPSFGAVANNLGLLLQRRGDAAGAKAAFEESVRVFEGSPHSPQVGVPLDNLATLARELGQPAEARALYQRARRVFSETYGPTHERTAAADLGLALVSQDEGRFDEAARLLDDVARLLATQNPNSRPTLEALLARATLAVEAGAPDEAQAKAVAAVREHLVQSDDLRGVRAELALLEGARAVLKKDLTTARAELDAARASATFVRWHGFSEVLSAWASLAEGRPPVCSTLGVHVPLARALKPSCR